MEEMALALGIFKETKDGPQKGQQARLSQYENRPDGPPWDMVVQYADYFGLKGIKRFDFFIDAFNSSKEITMNAENVKCVSKEAFIRFLAGVLVFERPEYTSSSPKSKVFDIERLIMEAFPGAFH
jgi:hypothetical protein